MYLAVTPGQLQEAARHCRNLAHVAYRVGEGSVLLRQSVLLQARGGLLAVTDQEAPPIDDPEKLSAAAVRECGRRGYTGVLLDFQSRSPDRLAFARQLAAVLAQTRRTLYVPEEYGPAVPGAVALICTALSGGDFAQRLREAASAAGGAGKLALDVQRLRMDFTLPARTGEGRPLTAEEFQALTEREDPAVFFSQELCARYFTYTHEGQTHFVLFDDAGTIRKKLQTGTALGYAAAFLMFPEVRDLLDDLFPLRPGR
ncbi:hypothetical protein [Dysosmobacter sp.]|uniref:hypothetical protein n=1 Tax=Dysosmobacter sp. TaxID=2591382 RepID=UPI002A9F0A44|nr:hypothetical protein [Dysosmobacter sp.]MCI6054681.1 hypothetical protein [Dysosmobacter sp.]MDY5508881.1 hypothetical protein [Dysosmobacter sp.]